MGGRGLAPGSRQLCSLPCRRIPLEEVPEDEDACAAWLHRLYQEKVSGRVALQLRPFGGQSGCAGVWVAVAFPSGGEGSYPRLQRPWS